MIGLGIDAGASSSRWCLLDAERGELGRGTSGPITGHIFTPDARQATLARLAELCRAVRGVARPDAVVAGVTGLHAGTGAAAAFVAEITTELELDAERVRVDNDMAIAYASVFAPGEGVLLYAGTGSVAYHVATDGEVLRAGGYGFLIDDAGAGFWIGREGLQRVFRWLDERGRPSDALLAREIYRALGSESWNEIVEVVYGGGRSRVAALAPAVAAAAAQGDEAARDILRRAGLELARLANAVLARLGRPLPVAFAGGVTRLGAAPTEALAGALPAGNPLRTVDAEPALAAARLALARAEQPAGGA